MKKVLFVIVALFAFSMQGYAEKFEYIYQGVPFKCKVNGNDNSVTITSFPVKTIKVIIPATVTHRDKTYTVKTISTHLNGVNYLAESLVVEEGIEEIDGFSFNEFRRLTSVTLPSTLRHIGKNAFRNNNGLLFELAANINEMDLRTGKDIKLRPARSTPTPQPTPSIPKPVPAPTPTPAPKPEPTPTPAPDPKPVPASKPVQSSLPDIDTNIPVTRIKRMDTYCVIIANENYSDVPPVEYARRDGEIFKEYCIKTLGIPERNIKTFFDATYTNVKRAINWMETTADVTGGKSKFILYYAGHGMPGEKDQMAYLIPTDGMPKDVSTCYKLSELYTRLGQIKSQNVTVFMDACFSGMKRGEDKPLVSARGIAIQVKDEALSGNTIVFSAASGDETAMAIQERKHGLFTYFLLSKLRSTVGKVTYGDLFESVSTEVKKNSWLENEKLQTPSANVSQQLKSTWTKLQF